MKVDGPRHLAPNCGHYCTQDRRGLCKRCYQKLGDSGQLPPPNAQGRPPKGSWSRRWVASLTVAQRLDLYRALTGVEG